MTDYEYIESKIDEGMYQTHMHTCLRDIGALAGGFLAAGRLSAADCDALCEHAKSLAINKAEAERKWKSAVVYGTKSPVYEQDYKHINIGGGFDALNLNSVVDTSEYKIVDEAWLEVEHIDAPSDEWNPCEQLKEYLSLLFQPDDYIGYCVQPFERDGRWLPDRGVYTQKAGDVIKALGKGSFEKAVGTLNNEKSGAWIRFNPLDGQGVADANVTEYRYALVESDGMEVEKQVAIYKKMELPCACIVHSGGKSAHAIVKVFASTLEEYRKRVDFLYEVCANNGLPVDKQNRNPSRYSRMPGVMRDGKKQYIIAKGCGKASFEEWENWIKDLNDNLPDFEPLTGLDIKAPPPLKPVVIDGVLREGFKMRIQGPSKAGKSFALIELAIAMAEGVEWLGHKCRPGRVLYINLELDRASALNRFAAIYRKLGIPPAHLDMIDTWNLRGKTMPLDKLTPKLIRRAKDRGYAMIILDPIYKVLTGDENSAGDMARFCNNFDQIASECGCCFVDCHHHSKGAQGGKRSSDRSSGSGVFARDPDAIIDLLPLDTEMAEPVLKDTLLNKVISEAADKAFYDGDWRSVVSLDAQATPKTFLGALELIFSDDDFANIVAAVKAFLADFGATGWEVSYTVRDFRTPHNHRVWFVYPLHTSEYAELLADCVPEGENPKAAFSRKKKNDNPKMPKIDQCREALALDPSAFKTISDVCERFDVSDDTVRRWAKRCGFKIVDKKIIVLKAENQ
ncbi:MAG: AAA family ATPase [Kiritimatiellae bacterium]|nr:AAA family ATPase [Kiritimatiellia bacterium]